MSDYQIRLKPVYSQTVPTPDDVVLPVGWNLAWHQLATLEALRNPSIDVVVNIAMTGDGKSLAAFLLSMIGRDSGLGKGQQRRHRSDDPAECNHSGTLPSRDRLLYIRSSSCRLTSQFRATHAVSSLWIERSTKRSRSTLYDRLWQVSFDARDANLALEAAGGYWRERVTFAMSINTHQLKHHNR